MIQSANPFHRVRVEFHILQSFPVTCLNRDDVGAPKSAMIGGSSRARVSSQCWKRAVRLEMRELGIVNAIRTKLVNDLIEAECMKLGATPEQAAACGSKVETAFIKKSETKKKTNNEEVADSESVEKTDTLLFLSPSEVSKIADAFAKTGFDPDKVIKQKDVKKQAKEIADLIGKPNYSADGLDIALFGRMVAQATSMNVEAAASFAHAISTHKVTNEVEFFTAVDDHPGAPDGSAHMGSLEFNSATYYRYVCLDLGQLIQTLGGGDFIDTAVEKFTKALYQAVPSARQATQSGACPWEFARVYVRRGQRLQAPFESAVKPKDGGFLEPSKQILRDYLDRKEKLAGSLFGKIKSTEFGEDPEFSIDDLVAFLKKTLQEVAGS